MQTLVRELERLWRNPAVWAGLEVAAAVLYLLVVIGGRPGAFLDLVGLVLAPTLLLWRRRPVAALVLGGVALAGALLGAWFDVASMVNIAPFTLIVVPILGARLDDRARVRTAGAVLAAAALVLAVLWAQAEFIGNSAALVLPTALLLALPLVAAAIWRRLEWRQASLRFVRDRLPSDLDASARFRATAAVAGVFYLVCVGFDALSGNPAIVLTALPIAAALPFALVKPDLSIGLATVGLVLTAICSVFGLRFGAGETLSLLALVVPVYGAVERGSVLVGRLALGLVVVAVLGTAAITGSATIGLLAAIVGAVPFFAVWAQRQRRQTGGLRERLTETRARAKAAERDVLLEQERTRLAREVHDVVAHSLAVVIAQADGARYAAQGDPTTVGPALEAIADTARDALGEVRTMLHELRTRGDGGPASGSADLPALVAGLRALDVEVREAVYGEPAALSEEADAAVYRIVQEALTNALRHGARGAQIDLELDWGEQALVVVVANAVPDAPREASERAGHGIAGMRERAALAGGECTAGIGSTGLFRVRASLPLEPVAAASPSPDHDGGATAEMAAFFVPEPAHA